MKTSWPSSGTILTRFCLMALLFSAGLPAIGSAQPASDPKGAVGAFAAVSASGGWYIWMSSGGYTRGGPYALGIPE